jgi:hypothetical protein
MSLRDRLEAITQQDFLADSEAASERDGYLSYRAEWHAAAWGLAAGFLATLTGRLSLLATVVAWLASRGGDTAVPGVVPYPAQFRTESAYLLGHMAAGVALGVVARAALVALGVPVPPLSVERSLSRLMSVVG